MISLIVSYFIAEMFKQAYLPRMYPADSHFNQEFELVWHGTSNQLHSDLGTQAKVIYYKADHVHNNQ